MIIAKSVTAKCRHILCLLNDNEVILQVEALRAKDFFKLDSAEILWKLRSELQKKSSILRF